MLYIPLIRGEISIWGISICGAKNPSFRESIVLHTRMSQMLWLFSFSYGQETLFVPIAFDTKAMTSQSRLETNLVPRSPRSFRHSRTDWDLGTRLLGNNKWSLFGPYREIVSPNTTYKYLSVHDAFPWSWHSALPSSSVNCQNENSPYCLSLRFP